MTDVLDHFCVQGLSVPCEVGIIMITCRDGDCGWSAETEDDPIPLRALVELANGHLKEAHNG